MGMIHTGNLYLDGELCCTKILMLLGISWNKKSCNIGLWTTTLQGTNLTYSLPVDFWIHAYPFLQVGCVCSLEGIYNKYINMLHVALSYVYIYKSRLYIHPWSLTTTHHDYCATSFTSPRCPTSAENHWGGKQLEIKQLGDCDFYQFLGDIYIHWCVYIHIYILYIFLNESVHLSIYRDLEVMFF